MNFDRETLCDVAGVVFSDSQFEQMTAVAGHYWSTEHLENAEGAFFDGRAVYQQLNRIAKLSAQLEKELSRTDINGYAASQESGGIYLLKRIAILRDEATQRATRLQIANDEERGQATPETTRARKGLVRTAARCWREAGGEGRGDHINSWGDREEYGSLIQLIQELVRQAGVPELLNAKTLQRDLREWPKSVGDSIERFTRRSKLMR